jgi:hypothetical protein
VKGEQNNFYGLPIFFCNHKFHKIENYFIFEKVHKEFEPIEKEFLIQQEQIVTKFEEIWA